MNHLFILNIFLCLFLCSATFARTQNNEVDVVKSKEDSIKSSLIGTWVYDKTTKRGDLAKPYFPVLVSNPIDSNTIYIFDKKIITIIKVVDCLETKKSYKYQIIINTYNSNFLIDIFEEKGNSSIEVEKLEENTMTTISYINDHYRTVFIKKE